MNTNSYYLLYLFFFYTLFLCTKSSFGFTSKVRCIERERQALLTFKKGLEDQFNVLSSWDSGEDNKECCNWRGVKCSNRTCHVIALHLDGVEYGYLTGELSGSLCELQHLRHLNLSHNGFSGAIPYQLGNLTKLQTLDLSFNRLTTNNLEWLSRLHILRELGLSSVTLNATDWAQVIFSLPFLERLSLAYCELGQVTPFSLHLANSSCNSLSVLDLRDNHFTSLTMFSWLFNLSKNLVTIDLSFNNLQGSIPNDFAKMISLKNINLAYNSLQGEIPTSFQNLSHLSSLDLSYNRLNESFPEFLRKISTSANESLELLKLQENQFYGPLKDLTRFSSLIILDISSNFLEGTLSEIQFSRL